jgi:hypothetical protein
MEAFLSLVNLLSSDPGALRWLSDTGAFRWGALGGISHEDRSFRTELSACRREGALGEETGALFSLQREDFLTRLAAAGAAGRELLLALSLTKARFAGKDSIKLEEVMVPVQRKLQKGF